MNDRYGELEKTRTFRCRACGKSGAVNDNRFYDNISRVVICGGCAAKGGHKSDTEPEVDNVAIVLVNHEERISKLEEQIKELINER